jgi:predicted metal-binding protein
MYTVSHFTTNIELKDFILNYRDADKFIPYCKECDRYNACWSCPPFDFDMEKYISSCEAACIIGTKIIIDADVIRRNTGWELCTQATYRMIEEVRSGLDKKLLELETMFPDSRAFFAGTCHICPAEKCMRIKGKPCIALDKVRPSLEAFGFDMSKTSAELLGIEMKWSHNGVLPEYFTLVSGFFSPTKLSLSYSYFE